MSKKLNAGDSYSVLLPVKDIVADPTMQVRSKTESDSTDRIDALKAAVDAHGKIHTPIFVGRSAEDGPLYVMDGFGRLAVALLRGDKLIPATDMGVFVDHAALTAAAKALSASANESLHKLTKRELAEAIRAFRLQGLTTEAIGARFGKSQTWASQIDKLHRIPVELLRAADRGEIETTSLISLASRLPVEVPITNSKGKVLVDKATGRAKTKLVSKSADPITADEAVKAFQAAQSKLETDNETGELPKVTGDAVKKALTDVIANREGKEKKLAGVEIAKSVATAKAAAPKPPTVMQWANYLERAAHHALLGHEFPDIAQIKRDLARLSKDGNAAVNWIDDPLPGEEGYEEPAAE